MYFTQLPYRIRIIMPSSKQHGVVKNIKNFFADLFRSPKDNISPAEQDQSSRRRSTGGGGKKSRTTSRNAYKERSEERSAQQTASEARPYSGAYQEGAAQWFGSISADEQETCGPQDTETAPDDNILAGGIYAVQEQEDAPYWLAKVLYSEEHVVHVLCYAERPERLTPAITEQNLTIGLNRQDGSFGIDHLPIPKADFLAKTVFLGQLPLVDDDFAGYRIYVDSVFDCLDEQAPDWLKKAGSYAAWRYDHHAMAALADRYLIGVDLLRDSRKALYWLNRLVHAQKELVQPGETVTKEQQILTGGIYACPQEDDRYRICKVVLKDKHGVQQLDFPALLGQLPAEPHPIRIVEQAAARRTGKPLSLSHISLDTSGFLAQTPLFLGLLPVTVDELHCYRAHLRKMFDGAEFRRSAWDDLGKRAEQGEIQAQMDVAYRYIDGDPLWEVKRNIPKAIRWFTEAANQGHGLAAYTLALLFQQGEEGIPPDPQLAFEWLVYAAQLNYGPAQLHTADCCRKGRGCTADAALAHAWYSLAITADNDLPEEAKKRAKQRKYEIEGTCSDEQLAEAKQYFQQFLQQLQESS